MQCFDEPMLQIPVDSLLNVHQDVRVETRCWPSPLLSITVADRGIADLFDAVGTTYIGDVVTKLERAGVCDNGLEAVLRWLRLVESPRRNVKLLWEIDVLLVLGGSTRTIAEAHELYGQDVRCVVEFEDTSALRILLAFVAADSDVGFAVISVQTIGEANTGSVWNGDTETEARWIAVSVHLFAAFADPRDLVFDSEQGSKVVLVDSFCLLNRTEQVLEEIVAVFLGLADGTPARLARSTSLSDCAVESRQLRAHAASRGVVACEQLTHCAGHASALLWTRFVRFVQKIEELRECYQTLQHTSTIAPLTRIAQALDFLLAHAGRPGL